MTGPPNFFEALTPFQHTRESFDSRYYRPAPDDWLLAVTRPAAPEDGKARTKKRQGTGRG